MASMEALDLMEQQFVAAAQNDFVARIATGQLGTDQKRKKQIFGIVEFTSISGCGGLMAPRLVISAAVMVWTNDPVRL